MIRAIDWDGVGPKRDCLLRLQWDGGESCEWVSFEWRDADVDQNEGYENDSGAIGVMSDNDPWSKTHGKYVPENGDFSVTHYAELPNITSINRIENDVEEGAVVS